MALDVQSLSFQTNPYFAISTALCSLLLLGFINGALKERRIRRRLPPGPRGYPIIANLLDIPREKAWVAYDQMCKDYGDIVYLEALGQRFVLLGSQKRIADIFEKRSSNYSDRMTLPILQMMGWDFNFALLGYGPEWRHRRRVFHQFFQAGSITKFQSTEFRETRALLRRLLVAPENFFKLTHGYFGTTFMKIAYGVDIQDSSDPYIKRAEGAVAAFAEAGAPGRFLVNILPILKYVPSWMPGTGWRKFASYWASVNADILNKPFNLVIDKMKEGTAVPCIASTLIDNLPDKSDKNHAEEESIARATAALTFLAGFDTTVTSAQCFFLAMAMFPDVQKKGQAEIDAMVGPHRLPNFSDRDKLLYTTAMVKECLRWQPSAPLSYHTSKADDEYDGYMFPKNTIFIGNAWALLHDPEIFPDPDAFNPDHYLNDQHPFDSPAFGFGRRVCPGRYLSCETLYIFIAMILAVYDISAPIDEFGNPVKLKPEMTSGLASGPVQFEVVVKPRSAAAAALIQALDD